MAASRVDDDARRTEISTLRWAVVTFVGGLAALALASIPLVAVAGGAGSEAFGHAVIAAAIAVLLGALLVVLILDLLGVRVGQVPGRRQPAARRGGRRPRGRRRGMD